MDISDKKHFFAAEMFGSEDDICKEPEKREQMKLF